MDFRILIQSLIVSIFGKGLSICSLYSFRYCWYSINNHKQQWSQSNLIYEAVLHKSLMLTPTSCWVPVLLHVAPIHTAYGQHEGLLASARDSILLSFFWQSFRLHSSSLLDMKHLTVQPLCFKCLPSIYWGCCHAVRFTWAFHRLKLPACVVQNAYLLEDASWRWPFRTKLVKSGIKVSHLASV